MCACTRNDICKIFISSTFTHSESKTPEHSCTILSSLISQYARPLYALYPAVLVGPCPPAFIGNVGCLTPYPVGGSPPANGAALCISPSLLLGGCGVRTLNGVGVLPFPRPLPCVTDCWLYKLLKLSCLECKGSFGSASCDLVLFSIDTEDDTLACPERDSRELCASSGVRLSKSRLSFSASLRRLRWGFSLQQMMMALTARRIARRPVRKD
jgi:hypothetical protein